jgi:hypothetical protein
MGRIFTPYFIKTELNLSVLMLLKKLGLNHNLREEQPSVSGNPLSKLILKLTLRQLIQMMLKQN